MTELARILSKTNTKALTHKINHCYPIRIAMIYFDFCFYGIGACRLGEGEGTPMRTIVNRLSQSDSAEAWKQVMSVSYSRSADCICLAYYNALTEMLPVPRIL